MEYTKDQLEAGRKLLETAIREHQNYINGSLIDDDFDSTLEVYLDDLAVFVGNEDDFNSYFAELLEEEYQQRFGIITNYNKDLDDDAAEWLEDVLVKELSHDNIMIKDEYRFFHGAEWVLGGYKCYKVDGVFFVLDFSNETFDYEYQIDEEFEFTSYYCFDDGIEKFQKRHQHH